jgi:CubicO group peptidase (beta-lactamase class C family)
MRHTNRISLAALTLACLPGAAVAQIPDSADRAWAEVVQEWEQTVSVEMVGASLALVHRGEIARFETSGHADIMKNASDGAGATGEDREVDEETIYHWASITKTFTAISIMQLRDRGLLSLDDAVVDYVPELRGVHNEFGSMEDITIRHLLSHSGGFRGGTWPWDGGQAWQPHEPTEWSQLVAMLPYTQIHFEPGSQFSYSNPGIIFLGRIIENVTGDVYEAYVDKNIFRPLGMRRAYFDLTPWHLLPYRSNQFFYYEGEEVPIPGGLDFNTGITVSNGGLNAPIPDMARYLAFLMGSPRGDQDAAAVLSRSSLEEMWQTVVPISEQDIGIETMGLSFFLLENDGNRFIGHTGSQRAFFSFIYVDPAAKVGVIAAFNTVGVRGENGVEPDTRAILNHTRAAVLNRVFPHFRESGG